MRRFSILSSAALALAAMPSFSSAALLYSEDFNVDHSANWVVNKSTGANANDAGSSANFNFDYSTVGVPVAPHTVGTSTVGLRMSANRTGGIFSGLSVSPTGQSFTGDYVVQYDAWINYNGPLGPTAIGGSGSTQAGGAGIGTAGTIAQWAGGTHDSVHFSMTGDGASSVDYRAYSSAKPAGYADASAVFSAGAHANNRNQSDPYYTTLFPGGLPAPAAQVALFPGQTGTTQAGAAGMQWVSGEIRVQGNVATWSLNGTPITVLDLSTVTLGGTNILLNYYDTSAASTDDTAGGDLIFGLIDNVRVESIPEPTSLLAACGLAVLARRRRA